MTEVLYVVAHSRSGSTLLARALGQLPAAISVGEIRHLWRRGLVENQPCGCGEPFSSCPFWSSVIRRAYGTVPPAQAERMAALVHAADRVWRMPLRREAAGRAEQPTVRHALMPLYEGIRDAASGATVVDSSKSPGYAYLLASMPGLRLRLIHLVRDCRGVAFSRLRRVQRGELAVRSERGLVARTAIEWAAVNTLAERLGRRHPYLLLRYEDFVQHPHETLGRIAQFAELPSSPMPFLEADRLHLSADHTVSGNQMRFDSGWLPLRADEEWRSRLGRIDAGILRYLGGGGLVRYGYV
jgi:Sulfotransferase family